MRYRFQTESGSWYNVDEDTKSFRRIPWGDAEDLALDNKDIPYLAAWIKLGQSARILWEDSEGNVKLRVTTPVKAMREIEYVSSPPDQSSG